MCEVSLRCKIQRRQKRRKGRVDMGEAPTKFGVQCTGDHLIRQRGLESDSDATYEDANSALVLRDRGPTGWNATLQ